MDMLGLQLAADAAADKAYFDDEGEERLREVLEWEFLADEAMEEVAAAIRQTCERFVCRLPALLELCFSDGTPFVDVQTQAWITGADQAQTTGSPVQEYAGLRDELTTQLNTEGVEVVLLRLQDLHATHDAPRQRSYATVIAADLLATLERLNAALPAHERLSHLLLVSESWTVDNGSLTVTATGGSAPLPGLTEAVTQQTGFACSLANPFDGMEIGDGVRLKRMTREAPSYLTSCGLALRRFAQ